jgi:hypothetical protein
MAAPVPISKEPTIIQRAAQARVARRAPHEGFHPRNSYVGTFSPGTHESNLPGRPQPQVIHRSTA